MALVDTIPKLQATAVKLKASGSGNEANTKALDQSTVDMKIVLTAIGGTPLNISEFFHF